MEAERCQNHPGIGIAVVWEEVNSGGGFWAGVDQVKPWYNIKGVGWVLYGPREWAGLFVYLDWIWFCYLLRVRMVLVVTKAQGLNL